MTLPLGIAHQTSVAVTMQFGAAIFLAVTLSASLGKGGAS